MARILSALFALTVFAAPIVVRAEDEKPAKAEKKEKKAKKEKKEKTEKKTEEAK